MVGRPAAGSALGPRDLSALVGLLATLEGLIQAGRVDDEVAARLGRRLEADGVSQGSGEREVRQALNDLNHRVRFALGEHNGPPQPAPVPLRHLAG